MNSVLLNAWELNAGPYLIVGGPVFADPDRGTSIRSGADPYWGSSIANGAVAIEGTSILIGADPTRGTSILG